MSGVISNLLRFTGKTFQSALGFRQFHALPTSVSESPIIKPTISSIWSTLSARTIIRNSFPKAREYKRLKVHGYKIRMKTRHGRRIIMRRILKGRFYLAH